MAGRGGPIKEMAGKRVGRLVVKSLHSCGGGRCAIWSCICDCGAEPRVSGAHLRSGVVVSCGCWRREKAAATHTTHGASRVGRRTRAYQIWCSMLRRCTSPLAKDYAYYGGRGISVCARWLEFENFISDIGDPKPGQSIERIDVNGNYEPANVKWASRVEQANNTRGNVLVDLSTGRMTMAQFARHIGIDYDELRRRFKAGDRTFGGEVVVVTYPKRTT